MSRPKKEQLDETSILNEAKKKLLESQELKKEKRSKAKKTLTTEEIIAKEKAHKEKILKNQEKRLAEHKRRMSVKESSGDPANKDRFYVSNAKLLEQLEIFRQSKSTDPNATEDEKRGTIPEELGRMVLKIATKITNHSNFKNYPFDMKQDMSSFACLKCMQAIYNYNFNYKNPFAYFTMTSYNACLTICGRHYREINKRKEFIKQALTKAETLNDINSQKLINNYIKEYLGSDTETDE